MCKTSASGHYLFNIFIAVTEFKMRQSMIQRKVKPKSKVTGVLLLSTTIFQTIESVVGTNFTFF